MGPMKRLGLIGFTFALLAWLPASPLQADVQQRPAGNEDCITYDPNAARFQKDADGTWLLMGGDSQLAVFDDEQDATNALALAQQYSALCFIGPRHQPGSGDVVVHYWKGTSTMAPRISRDSCIIYDPSHLKTIAHGETWLVVDGSNPVAQLATRHDASAALTIARQYRAYCTIGHDPGPGLSDDPVPFYSGHETRLHYFRHDSTVPTREEEELLLAVGKRQLGPDGGGVICYVSQYTCCDVRSPSPWLLEHLKQVSRDVADCNSDSEGRPVLLGPVEWITPHNEARIYYGMGISGIRQRYTAHKDFFGHWHLTETTGIIE
jgi:hypothetical protein